MRNIFTNDEIDAISNFGERDRRHPLNRIIFPAERDHQVVANTNRATARVDRAWLEGQKARLLNNIDFAESSSALGELRAYGQLREAQINVRPIPTEDQPTPDFHIYQDDPEDYVVVEVHSRQLEQGEAEALNDFNNAPAPDPEEHADLVEVREIHTTPFGQPAPGENTAENVISRVCAIKQNERQFSADRTNILWLDFQDEIWEVVFNYDSSFPIRTSQQAFFVGELWYAFYGWVDAPIFSGQSVVQIPPRYPHVRMRHDGRYRRNSLIDFTIFSFPRHLIIFENPFNNKEIPIWLKPSLSQIPWFYLESSIIDFGNNPLQDKILFTQNEIESIAYMIQFGV